VFTHLRFKFYHLLCFFLKKTESELKVIPKGAAIGGRNFASYEEAIRRKCIDSERRMTVRTSITMYQIMDSGNDHAGYQKITIKFGGEVIGLYDPFRLASKMLSLFIALVGCESK